MDFYFSALDYRAIAWWPLGLDYVSALTGQKHNPIKRLAFAVCLSHSYPGSMLLGLLAHNFLTPANPIG